MTSFLISGNKGLFGLFFFKLEDKYRPDLPPFRVLIYQFIYSMAFLNSNYVLATMIDAKNKRVSKI